MCGVVCYPMGHVWYRVLSYGSCVVWCAIQWVMCGIEYYPMGHVWYRVLSHGSCVVWCAIQWVMCGVVCYLDVNWVLVYDS